MTLPRAARPSRRAPRVLAGAALLALVVPLAACSGDGGVQEFCDQGEEAMAEVDAAGSLSGDPQGFADAIASAREGFEKVEAPDEIADDWQVFTTAFAELDDALDGIDPTDQQAFTEALTEFSQTAQSDELGTAGDNLSTYITENCD